MDRHSLSKVPFYSSVFFGFIVLISFTKDLSMSVLGKLLDYFMSRRKERLNLVVMTRFESFISFIKVKFWETLFFFYKIKVVTLEGLSDSMTLIQQTFTHFLVLLNMLLKVRNT